MQNSNYLNIEEKDFDIPIYRVFSIERLLELFELRKNTLVKPKLWDDPFENIAFKYLLKTEQGETHPSSIGNLIFGQCWSLHQETDAMWRIYSPDKNGVKIKTTIRKLASSLFSSEDGIHQEKKHWIGKVKYFSQQDIVAKLQGDHLADIQFRDPSFRRRMSTLLMKRKEFSHEKEVRMLYNKLHTKPEEDIYQYPINPVELFDQIIFDPRMNDYLISSIKDYLKRAGFNKYIGKSKLYQLPKDLTYSVK